MATLGLPFDSVYLANQSHSVKIVCGCRARAFRILKLAHPKSRPLGVELPEGSGLAC